MYYILILFLSCYLFFTNSAPLNIPLKIGGYVRHSIVADSRQTQTDDAGQFIYFPLPKVFDATGRDINAHPTFNMLDIRSRVWTEATVSYHEMSARGFIEGDFNGRSGMLNIFRLRHAFIECKWPCLKLIIGQTDIPMYVKEFEANTVAVDNGAPFHPQTRNPQLSVWYNNEIVEVGATAITQVEAVSDGPFGTSGQYLQNAILPHLDGQIRLHWDKHCFIVDVNFKRLVPRLFSTVTVNDESVLFKVHERINSWSSFAQLALIWEQWSLIAKITYAQNLREYKMLSGYAIQSRDPLTGEQTYTNTQVIAGWVDINYHNCSPFTPGLFVGYSKNLGFSKDVENSLLIDNFVDPLTVFSRAPNLDYLLRVAPHLFWKHNNIVIGTELEYSRAAFGPIKPNGNILNPEPVFNVRVHIAAFYYF